MDVFYKRAFDNVDSDRNHSKIMIHVIHQKTPISCGCVVYHLHRIPGLKRQIQTAHNMPAVDAAPRWI